MSDVSRRDLFRALLGRSKDEAVQKSVELETDNKPQEPIDQVALILDKFCLAYQGSFCSVCSEHCPEEGAILVTQGKPRVVPDACTGCQKCQEVCPAPKNAVFLVATKPKQGMIGKTVGETEPEEDKEE